MLQAFISDWNGVKIFLSSACQVSNTLNLYTDILHPAWFQGNWEQHQKIGNPPINIAWQKHFATVVAGQVCGELLRNHRIKFHCNNEAVVNMINTKHSQIPRGIDLLRHLTLLTLQHNIFIWAEHIPGRLLKLLYLLLATPNTKNFATLMTLAAMALTFFSFMRLVELTSNAKFNQNVHLTRNSITLSPQYSQFMNVLIKESNTDPFHLVTQSQWGYPLRDLPSQCFKKIPRNTPCKGWPTIYPGLRKTAFETIFNQRNSQIVLSSRL